MALIPFVLKAITRIFVKESVSTIQQNSNEMQTISLLDPKEIQKEAKNMEPNLFILGVSE
jgi:hypothetical protein